jgi:SAM-dependent methyltransferase
MTNIEEFFDAEADRYDRAYDDSGRGGRLLRSRLAQALELIGDGPGEVLDAGMGAGRLCRALDARGWTVWGVALSPAMVEAARVRLPLLRERLVGGSITALPFPDGRFDTVAATGVLEYVTHDLSAAAHELARVLRPGGTAVVSFPNHRAFGHVWRGRVLYPAVRVAKRVVPRGRPAPPAMPIRSVDDLENALRNAGLVVRERRPPEPSRRARQVVLSARKATDGE